MKIKRGGNMCAIEKYAHYPVIVRKKIETDERKEENEEE